MMVIDDILLSPFKGFMWIMKELHNAVQREQEGEADRLTGRLSELYMLLETGQMTQEEFDAEEAAVLARLDEIESRGEIDDDDDGEEDDEEEDESDDEEAGDGDDEGGLVIDGADGDDGERA